MCVCPCVCVCVCVSLQAVTNPKSIQIRDKRILSGQNELRKQKETERNSILPHAILAIGGRVLPPDEQQVDMYEDEEEY